MFVNFVISLIPGTMPGTVVYILNKYFIIYRSELVTKGTMMDSVGFNGKIRERNVFINGLNPVNL